MAGAEMTDEARTGVVGQCIRCGQSLTYDHVCHITEARTPVTPQRVRDIALMFAPWMSRVYSPAELLPAYHDLRAAADQLERNASDLVENARLERLCEMQDKTIAAQRKQLERNAEVQWKPIETAPMDEEWLLLFYDEELVPCVAFWGRQQKEWLKAGGGTVPEPTHWHPLPKPPEAK